MEKAKSMLSAIAIFSLWVFMIVLAIYCAWKLPWFIAIPFITACISGISYAFILIYEEVK